MDMVADQNTLVNDAQIMRALVHRLWEHIEVGSPAAGIVCNLDNLIGWHILALAAQGGDAAALAQIEARAAAEARKAEVRL